MCGFIQMALPATANRAINKLSAALPVLHDPLALPFSADDYRICSITASAAGTVILRSADKVRVSPEKSSFTV